MDPVGDMSNDVLLYYNKDALLKMQADLQRCSENCSEKRTENDVQRCIQNCEEPWVKTQNFIQLGAKNVQSVMSQCAMDCRDKLRDRLTTNMSVHRQQEFLADMEQCSHECAVFSKTKLHGICMEVKNKLSAME